MLEVQIVANPEFTTEELESEEWRDVPGYEGVYSASNLGRVRRDLQVAGCRAGRILGDGKDVYGYARATLCRNNQRIKYKVHQLIAKMFIGPRPSGYTVNHIDGIKSNNRVSNLEYCTARENREHATRIGLLKHGPRSAEWKRKHSLKGAHNPKAKLTNEQILEIRRRAATRAKTQEALAAEYGITRCHLQAIVYRKVWKHI